MRMLAGNRFTLGPAGAFVLLVLVPSLLLGYFSLRAVDSERAVSRQRVLNDASAYGEFVAGALQQELQRLSETWSSLVPRGVRWETRRHTVIDAVDRARGVAFVADAVLLHGSGAVLHTSGAPGTNLRLPAAPELERFESAIERGEEAQFESADLPAAAAAYTEILRATTWPPLRAIAHARLAGVALELERWEAALAHCDTLLGAYADAYDFDNQPLRLQALLHRSRAQAGRGDTPAALAALLDAYADLQARSHTMGTIEFDLLRQHIDARLRALLPAATPEQSRRAHELAAAPKQPVGTAFFALKLSRKLARAVLDRQPYTTPLRYVSDVADGEPYVLAYTFLPDSTGAGVSGLVGFHIDVAALTRDWLPSVMAKLDLSAGHSLSLVDEGGNVVMGSPPASDRPALALHPLAEPFSFWSVALHGGEIGVEPGVAFRTKVLLYVVALLLLTIVFGSLMVWARIRRTQRLARSKTHFVSSVSHELRTPLTSIRMYSEMLDNPGLDAGTRAGYLLTIRRECDRLQRLIETVLDFARRERGGRTLALEFEEIGGLVRDVAEGFRAQAESAGFAFRVDVDETLPELRIDADAMRQVLWNLLSNALKYSQDERFIAVRAFRSGDYVAIEVEDRGIGIDPALHERIFEDFFRADSSLAAARGGVGLGLTLARRIVAEHGGTLTVDSAPGRGSRFTVRLPVPDAEASAITEAPAGAAVPAATVRGGGRA